MSFSALILMSLCVAATENGTPSAEVPDMAFMELNDEMKEWLHENVASKNNMPRQRMVLLAFAIFNEDFLNLQYSSGETKTPIETFRTRSGNCMSFTTMYIAMARHLGLHAYFQEVTNYPTWDRKADVIVNNKHINVVVKIYNKEFEIDFNPFQPKKRHAVQQIPDYRAEAQFYNNIGAEHYAKGEVEKSIAYFEKSLEIDPRLTYAWSNLGVSYRALNQLEASKRCYLKALDIDRFQYTAMTNLAHLHMLLGQTEDADRYFRKVRRYRSMNPYYHAAKAEDAMEIGEYDDAVKYFKKAINRRGQDSEFYFGMAKAYFLMGDHKKTERYLRKARSYSLDDKEKLRYSQKLENLLAGS